MLVSRNTSDSTPTVAIEIDGEPATVPIDISVAAAVMSVRPEYIRTTSINEQPRASYCMMGVCFDCLIEINGIANQRACLTTVEDGMRIRRHHGKRTV